MDFLLLLVLGISNVCLTFESWVEGKVVRAVFTLPPGVISDFVLMISS